jgi:hypothetical protein
MLQCKGGNINLSPLKYDLTPCLKHKNFGTSNITK